MEIVMRYSYPVFSKLDLFMFRLGGPGLGNLLFPWARSIVASKKHNLQPIASTWPQFKLGPIVRMEQDKRFYVGLFHSNNNLVQGLKRLLLLILGRKIEECSLYDGSIRNRHNEIVIFEGMSDYFKTIKYDHELVRDEFLAIINQRHKRGLYFDFSESISVHVRLGDFLKAENPADIASGIVNLRTSIFWYIEVIKRIRDELGQNMLVHVFSDGSDLELMDILKLPNVQRQSFGSGLSDLLALSQANILIASGSTFSMWASYLGRMPVVWPEGQLRQKLYYNQSSLEIECNSAEDIPCSFFKTGRDYKP